MGPPDVDGGIRPLGLISPWTGFRVFKKKKTYITDIHWFTIQLLWKLLVQMGQWLTSLKGSIHIPRLLQQPNKSQVQSELKISDLRFNRSSYTLHSRHLKHLINLISSNNSLNRKISLAVSTCQFDCRDCEPLPSLKTDIELDGKE